MGEITLLRHGQASFGTDNYDRLSDIGHQQSQWLGAHLNHLGASYERLVAGTMVRHRETADGVLLGLGQSIPVEFHDGLNEYDFQGLLTSLKQQHSEQWIDTGQVKHDYYHNIKQALQYWMDGIITSDGRDSWKTFGERIHSGFAFACDTPAKRTLIVSSGGPISVILASILRLDHRHTCDLALQIKNTSTAKLLYRRPITSLNDFTLDNFNDVSHLLTEDKQHLITFS